MAGTQSRFAFMLPDTLHAALRAAAMRLERSEAWVARTALQEWLARLQPAQDAAAEGLSTPGTPEAATGDPEPRTDAIGALIAHLRALPEAEMRIQLSTLDADTLRALQARLARRSRDE